MKKNKKNFICVPPLVCCINPQTISQKTSTTKNLVLSQLKPQVEPFIPLEIGPSEQISLGNWDCEKCPKIKTLQKKRIFDSKIWAGQTIFGQLCPFWPIFGIEGWSPLALETPYPCVKSQFSFRVQWVLGILGVSQTLTQPCDTVEASAVCKIQMSNWIKITSINTHLPGKNTGWILGWKSWKRVEGSTLFLCWGMVR